MDMKEQLEEIRKLTDDHYENIPTLEDGDESKPKLYEAGVVAYISTYHDKILNVLNT